MLALKIILGIILFFVIILSVKFRIKVHSEDGIDLTVRWLFLKFRLLPTKEKKPKKEKKKKKPKKKKEKSKKDAPEELNPEGQEPEEQPEKKDETVPEPKNSGKKKDNIFVRFYKNNGVSGTLELVQRLSEVLSGMFRGIGRAFVFEEINISLIVSAEDSAQTAIKYGKTCSALYPAMGLITDTMRVKKYNAEVIPDFIGGTNKARLQTEISVIPRKLINAVIAMVFRMLFKVGIRFLRGTKKDLRKK